MDKLEAAKETEAIEEGESEELLPKLKTIDDLSEFNNRLENDGAYRKSMVSCHNVAFSQSLKCIASYSSCYLILVIELSIFSCKSVFGWAEET